MGFFRECSFISGAIITVMVCIYVCIVTMLHEGNGVGSGEWGGGGGGAAAFAPTWNIHPLSPLCYP